MRCVSQTLKPHAAKTAPARIAKVPTQSVRSSLQLAFLELAG